VDARCCLPGRRLSACLMIRALDSLRLLPNAGKQSLNVADERPRVAASEGSNPRAARSAGSSLSTVCSIAWLGASSSE
jgi:hypothetical protein